MAENLILTTKGLAKLASATPEDQLKLADLAVGDGNGGYPPLDPSMTALVNEVWRGTASAPIRDQDNGTVLIFETIIPADDGGFFIREIGLFDDDGDMIAIGQTGVVEKPTSESGTPITMTVRVRLALANASQTNLIISDAPYIDHQATTNRDAADAHPIESITGLRGELDGLSSGKVDNNDPRLTNAREWTASTVSQAEAEAGTATTRRAWTAQRVRQAILAWYNGASGTIGRTILGRSTAAQVRGDLELGSAATRNVGTGSGDVLEVGAFGLGTVRPPRPAGEDLNNALNNGFYRINTTDSNSPPVEYGADGAMIVFGSAPLTPDGQDGDIIQLASTQGGNDLWIRGADNADSNGDPNWREWKNIMPLGVGQTWKNVMGSRSKNTTYTNTTGKPIIVTVVGVSVSLGRSASISLIVDGLSVDFCQVTADSSAENANAYPNVSAVVPDGSSYKVERGAFDFNISIWQELR